MFKKENIPSAEAVAEKIGQSAADAIDSVKESTHQVLTRAHDLSDNVSHRASEYVKNDPLKSVMIAAASGAFLMAAVSFLTRSRH